MSAELVNVPAVFAGIASTTWTENAKQNGEINFAKRSLSHNFESLSQMAHNSKTSEATSTEPRYMRLLMCVPLLFPFQPRLHIIGEMRIQVLLCWFYYTLPLSCFRVDSNKHITSFIFGISIN